MAKKVTPPDISKKGIIPPVATSKKSPDRLCLDFSKFNLNCVCIPDEFNNHFKDYQHFANVSSAFLGTILPKLTSHTYDEVREGGKESKVLHFHTIDDKHLETVKSVLKEYGYLQESIKQMFEGNSIYEFSAALGHTTPARVVCHKIGDIIQPLFFDTNHHVFLNERLVKESLFYEECPMYIDDTCPYMPTDCFAVSFLDEEKIKEASGYNYSPVK